MVAAARPGLKPPGCEQRRMNPAFHHRKPPNGGVVGSKGLQPRSGGCPARADEPHQNPISQPLPAPMCSDCAPENNWTMYIVIASSHERWGMTAETKTVAIPQALYQRLERLAHLSGRSLESLVARLWQQIFHRFLMICRPTHVKRFAHLSTIPIHSFGTRRVSA
jgi:hypothetical protein